MSEMTKWNKDLSKMKEIDIQTVDPTTLVDISQLTVDTGLSVPERMNDFIQNIKNPYCFLVGETVVKIEFENTDVTLEQRLEHILMNQ